MHDRHLPQGGQPRGGQSFWRGSVAFAPALLAAGLWLWLLSLMPAVTGGAVLHWRLAWLPEYGVAAAFMLDGLALMFALLITGIGALILVYTVGYMRGHPRAGWLRFLLLTFMLAMLGLVLAGDLITLFVFWELTGVVSWLLIGFERDDPRARRNALQALLITSAGGLALLAGLVLLAQASGTGDLGQILAGGKTGGGVQLSPHYPAILALVLLGAFTKSAQFPFHVWLPNAMSAPTPVSAYLHSATMVKAGIYLLARLHPVLSGTPGWSLSLTSAGLVTAVWASVLALRQSDLKQSLACTTLAMLGVLTMLLAGQGAAALMAALVLVVVHASYKAALFMVVGAIDHATGTRELGRLGGLARAMPFSALAAGVAGLSMAGLPPLPGWFGKELALAGSGALVILALVVVNALSLAVALMVALRPFAGAPGAAVGARVHEAGWAMLAGPLVLAAFALACGLMPGVVLAPLTGAALAVMTSGGPVPALHLWGGFNAVLGLSFAGFALGLVLYLARGRLIGASGWIDRLPAFDRGWDRLLDGLRAVAGWQTGVLQNGRLGRYLLVVFAVLLGLLGAALIRGGPPLPAPGAAPLLIWLIAGFALAGAGLALQTVSRIAAIAGVGTVGLAVALIFIWFGAPDVAMTQLMVETLSAVLLSLALLRLPALGGVVRAPLRARAVRAVLAGGLGLCFALVILMVAGARHARLLTGWFEAHAYSAAHGRNIVNVILVDFRAFDTLGEISVVMLAALGAFVLLRRRGEGR